MELNIFARISNKLFQVSGYMTSCLCPVHVIYGIGIIYIVHFGWFTLTLAYIKSTVFYFLPKSRLFSVLYCTKIVLVRITKLEIHSIWAFWRNGQERCLHFRRNQLLAAAADWMVRNQKNLIHSCIFVLLSWHHSGKLSQGSQASKLTLPVPQRWASCSTKKVCLTDIFNSRDASASEKMMDVRLSGEPVFIKVRPLVGVLMWHQKN